MAVALFALLFSSSSWARPYTVEDMLRSESFGMASVDPGERWVVFERRGPYASAARFDLVSNSAWTVSALWIQSLRTPGQATRLLPDAEGAGHVLGPWSPSGRRLLIYRLWGEQWEAGVVDVDTRVVRWLGLTPELAVFGRIAQWRSDDELLLIARPDRSLPRLLVHATRAQDRLRDRWTATAAGASVQSTRHGSGAFAETRRVEPDNALFRITVPDGRKERLAAGNFIDLEVAPNGAHVAAVETGSPVGFDPEVSFDPQAISASRRLLIVDLSSGHASRPCPDCDVAPNLLTWSPDGRRLLVWTRGGAGWLDGALTAVDAAAGRIDRLSRQGLDPYTGGGVAAFNTVYADWQGDRPLLFARPSPGERHDWYRLDSDRAVNLTAALAEPTARLGALDGENLLLLSGGTAWRVDRAGRARPLSDSLGLKPFAGLGTMASMRQMLNSPQRRSWMTAQTATGHVLRPGVPEAPLHGAAAEPGFSVPVFASRNITVERQVANGVQTLAWRRRDGAAHPLAVINAHLAQVTFARPVPVRHPGPSGSALTSWLYLPPEPRPGPIPLVVLSYPGGGAAGPNPEPAAFNSWANAELVAGAGFAVLVLNLPPRRWPQDPFEGYVDQIEAIVHAAVEQNPTLDEDRVGHWGHSFGGYASLIAATRSNRFRSIIALAGVSDMAAMWGQFSPDNAVNGEGEVSIRQRAGWAERSQGAMGGPPWIDPDRYVRNSPLFDADQIRAPVLLIHGDRDLLPVAQSEMMFSALWRQNKDARLITYWGENHHLWSPANIRDLYAQIVNWLRETLVAPTRESAAPPSGEPSSR